MVHAPYLERTSDVVKGDIFVTSGLAGHFPNGYPVGRVVKIERDPNAPFLQILTEPSANLTGIREILLIWNNSKRGGSLDQEFTNE